MRPDSSSGAEKDCLFDSDLAFRSAFGVTIQILGHHVSVDLMQATGTRRDSGLIVAVHKVLSYDARNEYFARDWEGFRLGLLAMDLDELSVGNPTAYGRCVTRLRVAREDEFPGIRLEIFTAVKLVRAGYSFTSPDPPDFLVTTRFGNVAVECTSVQVVRLAEDKSLLYKLESALRSKSQKPYAGPDSVLVVDYTNLLFMAGHSSVPTTHSQARALAREAAEKTPFGAIVLLAAMKDLDQGMYWHLADDFISSKSSAKVRLFCRGFIPRRTTMNGRFATVRGI